MTDPCKDRFITSQLRDDDFELPLEFSLLGFIRPPLGREVRHVLHDQDSEFVGGGVVYCGLDFDVLAKHVVAEVLERLDVVGHGFVCWGCVETVWPVALLRI